MLTRRLCLLAATAVGAAILLTSNAAGQFECYNGQCYQTVRTVQTPYRTVYRSRAVVDNSPAYLSAKTIYCDPVYGHPAQQVVYVEVPQAQPQVSRVVYTQPVVQPQRVVYTTQPSSVPTMSVPVIEAPATPQDEPAATAEAVVEATQQEAETVAAPTQAMMTVTEYVPEERIEYSERRVTRYVPETVVEKVPHRVVEYVPKTKQVPVQTYTVPVSTPATSYATTSYSGNVVTYSNNYGSTGGYSGNVVTYNSGSTGGFNGNVVYAYDDGYGYQEQYVNYSTARRAPVRAFAGRVRQAAYDRRACRRQARMSRRMR